MEKKNMKTIPFDIKLRKDIQSEENHYQGRYKVQTRDGNDVKIIYWDRRDRISREYSIVGLQTVNDTEFITTYTKDGKFSTFDNEPNNNDLILIDTWEPKFKVGDTIKRIKQTPGLEDVKVTIKEIRNYSYYFSDDSWMYLFEQDGWELVPEESKLTEFEKELANCIYKSIGVVCMDGMETLAKEFAPKLITLAKKEIIEKLKEK